MNWKKHCYYNILLVPRCLFVSDCTFITITKQLSHLICSHLFLISRKYIDALSTPANGLVSSLHWSNLSNFSSNHFEIPHEYFFSHSTGNGSTITLQSSSDARSRKLQSTHFSSLANTRDFWLSGFSVSALHGAHYSNSPCANQVQKRGKRQRQDNGERETQMRLFRVRCLRTNQWCQFSVNRPRSPRLLAFIGYCANRRVAM